MAWGLSAMTDFTPCHGSHQELSRDKEGGACCVTLRDGCIMPRYVLAGMLLVGVMLQYVGFPAHHSSHEGSAYKWAVGRREAISCVTALLWLSQSSEGQPPLNGQWLQHGDGGHDGLSSSFNPWCFVNLYLEHQSQQNHVSAPWSLPGRQLPVYFYCFACLQSLD